MSERVLPGPVQDSACIKEAVCIHTKKIFDSCRDKDCVEDLRVYLTCSGQSVVDAALSVKGRSAELLYVYIDVEEIPFNQGFFTVDLRYFYKIKLDAYVGMNKPCEVKGLAVFDKRVILFGSEGSAKIFASCMVSGDNDVNLPSTTNLPTAVVESVDPILLSVKVVDVCGCSNICDTDISDVPGCIGRLFDEDLMLGTVGRRVYVTLGQFSIIRLERDTQLLIPSYDYCMPDKDCAASDDDPCELFRKIQFPVDEFFPPSSIDCNLNYKSALSC